MPTLFRPGEEPRAAADGRIVVCAGLDPAGIRWAVPAAVSRASRANVPLLAYVHAADSGAVDEVLALAGSWADRVRCIAVWDRGRIADLVEAVLAEGSCEAVFVGFESHDALPVGCRLCAEAEAESEAVLMPFNPR